MGQSPGPTKTLWGLHVFMNPTPALSLGRILPVSTSSLLSPCRVLQDSVSTVPGIHEDPSVQGHPAAAAGPGEGAAPMLPAKFPGGLGGHSSPTSGPNGPMVAAGLGPAVMAEASSSGDSVPRAERHLGGPQPGRVLCSLSQAQLGRGSLEGGRHKAPRCS